MISFGTPIINVAPTSALVPLLSAMVGGDLERIGTKIMEAASQLAPVLTGKLAASGHLETDESGVVHVIFGGGEVDYAVYVEFGTEDTPTFAFLRRGAEAAGYSP